MSPETKRYEDELLTAVRAAREAGQLIQTYAGNVSEEMVREKGLNDLVTEVDEAAQRLIIRTLSDRFPASEFLAEEGDEFSSDQASGGYTWIVDPIDGTTNFMHGVPPYAVSIALRDGKDMVVGVVLDVSRDELFTAVRGQGLYIDGKPGRVSRTAALAEGLVTTGFPYRTVAHIDVYLEVLGEFMRQSQGIRRPGSASIDLAYVAAGRFDGFFESGLKAWDVAAGALLVEEGRGRVTDYRGGPYSISAEQLVASNGNIHSEMIHLLTSLQDVRI